MPLALGLLLLAFEACAEPPRPPEPKRPPILLITFEGLRADAVGALGGEPGLTPHLDRLIGEADWAGRGVAPSSWTVPAAASLLTGLPPWKHQALTFDQPRLASELITLPEALAPLGYDTAAFVTGHWISAQFGFQQGFELFEPMRRGGRAQGYLEALRGDPVLVWIHFKDPSPPWTRRDWALPGEPPGRLPQRLGRVDLERYLDPEIPVPAGMVEASRLLYRQNVAWADERLGRLLASLEGSGHAEETLIAVAATHGQELGEHGRGGDGTSLARPLLEVPLVVRLPAGFSRPVAVPAGRRLATARLWATLVEAAGGEPPPAVAPSLFAAGAQPVLSELYQVGGTNRFSLVDGDRQLLWQARFAPPESEYYLARQQLLGDPPDPPLDAPRQLLERLGEAFRSARPVSGRGADGAGGAAPELTLLEWRADGGTVVVDEPAASREMAVELERRWAAFVDDEPPVRQMARRWPSEGVRRGDGGS